MMGDLRVHTLNSIPYIPTIQKYEVQEHAGFGIPGEGRKAVKRWNGFIPDVHTFSMLPTTALLEMSS